MASTAGQPSSHQEALAAQLGELGVALFSASRGDPQQRDEAIAMLEQAVAHDPNNDRLLLNLGDAYVLVESELSLALATDLYEDVLARNREDAGVLGRLAKTYALLGNSATALDYAQRRLETSSSQTAYDAALQMTTIALSGGQADRGIALLNQFLDLRPNHAAIRLLLATLLLENNQEDLAFKALDEVIQREPASSPFAAEADRIRERIDR
jgi:predicted Zn-dependent protease